MKDQVREAMLKKLKPWKPQLPAGEHKGVKIAHHKVGKGYLLVAANREGLHALSASSPEPLDQYGIPLTEVRFGDILVERQGPLAVIVEIELQPGVNP